MNQYKYIMILIVFLLFPFILFSQPKGVFLGECTWPEAERLLTDSPIVILPFGAGAKEHGPHLPMNADQKVMEYLCDKAVEAFPVVVAPPILHGWFPAFREFPGTEVANPELFKDYIFEVANSLIKNGANRILFLNTGIFKATGERTKRIIITPTNRNSYELNSANWVSGVRCQVSDTKARIEGSKLET